MMVLACNPALWKLMIVQSATEQIQKQPGLYAIPSQNTKQNEKTKQTEKTKDKNSKTKCFRRQK